MGLTKNLGWLSKYITADSNGNIGIGVPSPVTQFNVGNSSHGIGISYLGANSLPSIAGIFTDTGVNGGQGYGDLQIKPRSDFSGYSINFFTALTANVPVERMRIASSGNVGIGTTNPLSTLHVAGSTTMINSSADPLIFKYSAGYGNTSIGSDWSSSVDSSNNLKFKINNAAGNAIERMRIQGNACVGINTTTPDSYLAGTIGSVVYHTSSPARSLANSSTYWLNYLSGTEYRFWNPTTTNAHIIYLNGNYYFAGTNVSDIRLKEDIEDLNINYTEKILGLNPKSYYMKDSRNRKHYGFIAQEVYETIPDIISGDINSEDYLGVDYNGIIAILVGSIKELTARLEILENK